MLARRALAAAALVGLLAGSLPLVAHAQAPFLTPQEQAFLDAHGPIRVVISSQFAPFMFIQDGVPRGINVDLLRLMTVKTGIEFQVIPAATLQESLAKLEDGSADVIGSLGITPQRQRDLALTEPYIVAGSTFWVASEKILAPGDLRGHRVAVVAGSSAAGIVQAQLPTAHVVGVPDTATGLVGVAQGDYEGFLGSVPVTAYHLHELNLSSLHQVGAPVEEVAYAWATTKENAMVHALMERAMAEVSHEERAGVFIKWTGYDLSPGAHAHRFAVPGWVAPAVGVTGVALVAGLGYAALLKRQVRARTRALSRSNALLNAVIEGTSDAVYVKSSDGRYLLVNQAGAAYVGRTRAEVLGKTDVELFDAPSGAGIMAADRRVMASGTVVSLEEDTQVNGVRRVFSAMKAPHRDDRGKIIGLVGISRDVTERRQMEADLRRATAEAQAASEAKAQFLANMSHEIRTPLNAVIGMTTLLTGTRLDEEQREHVDTIRMSGEHLLTVISDILDLSKIEGGGLRLERHAFDPREAVEEALDLVAYAAAEKDIELIEDIAPGVPREVLGDAGRVRQVLVNLLGNAVKFTDRGEITVSATAAPVEDGQVELRFCVRDTGIGIAPDHMARLFTAFNQGDGSSTRARGGTGLGLAISRRLVELMGGRIWAESEPGQGSAFRFIVRVGAVAPETAAAAQDASGTHALLGRRVLLVERNAAQRAALAQRLESWGMLVASAATPEHAVAMAKSPRQLDAAVLAHGAAGLDALQVARELRRTHGPGFPIVLLTPKGWRREDLAARGNELGVILTKPARGSHLQEALLRSMGAAEAPVVRAPEEPPSPPLPLRILLAEDNPTNQLVALRMLQRLGYHADVANNGVEAVQAIARQPYDLVLMDVQMPEMDGLEATRRIRARRPDSDDGVRIVALTAHALEDERQRCLDAGMDDYVPKPVRLDALAAALARASGARRAQAERHNG